MQSTTHADAPNRAAKSAAIADYLAEQHRAATGGTHTDAARQALAVARRYTPATWATIAEAAGVRGASPETISQVLRRLEISARPAPADPFAGLG